MEGRPTQTADEEALREVGAALDDDDCAVRDARNEGVETRDLDWKAHIVAMASRALTMQEEMYVPLRGNRGSIQTT